MLFVFAALVLLTGVNAHFHLLYPEPRGAFVADQEPNFCGGYTNAVSNRSTFPLSGGFFSIKSGHPSWTSGVLLSTVQNPNSFDNFSSNGEQQIVGPYAKEENAGTFCIPLNISASGIDGLKDGSNVTIQIVYAGGDGNLYQANPIPTLHNYTIPSNVTCENVTATTTTSTDTTGTNTAAPSQSVSGAIGVTDLTAGYTVVVLASVGVMLSFL